MNDHQILSQSASTIERVIGDNNRLKNQNVTLTSRVDALEKQLKEHEAHALVMQKNQLVFAMNAAGTKEIGEELRKSIISTLEEWSSDLYHAMDREIDRSNCSDRGYYLNECEKNQEANSKRSQFIAMLEEVLTPVTQERYLLNADGTRVVDLDGKPIINPDYQRKDKA